MDVYFLLDDEVFKTKTLKPILFYFYLRLCWLVLLVVWEQFLALTYLVSLSRTKLKYIFLGISLFFWFWEVNKVKKYFRLQIFTGDSTIKDSTAKRILLTEKWRSQMERLGIILLLSSMIFCSYSSILSRLSHCMSKELFFVLSIPMIIKRQVHIPLWKKKICILLVLLMLILFLHFKYMFSMIYIYPYLLKLLILVIL